MKRMAHLFTTSFKTIWAILCSIIVFAVFARTNNEPLFDSVASTSWLRPLPEKPVSHNYSACLRLSHTIIDTSPEPWEFRPRCKMPIFTAYSKPRYCRKPTRLMFENPVVCCPGTILILANQFCIQKTKGTQLIPIRIERSVYSR